MTMRSAGCEASSIAGNEIGWVHAVVGHVERPRPDIPRKRAQARTDLTRNSCRKWRSTCSDGARVRSTELGAWKQELGQGSDLPFTRSEAFASSPSPAYPSLSGSRPKTPPLSPSGSKSGTSPFPMVTVKRS